jgi:hypothetical protein
MKAGFRSSTQPTCAKKFILRNHPMQGINFIVDDQSKKIAVVIDLEKYGELWEDFYDNLLVTQRKNEPRESLESVKASLLKQGKLSEHG